MTMRMMRRRSPGAIGGANGASYSSLGQRPRNPKKDGQGHRPVLFIPRTTGIGRAFSARPSYLQNLGHWPRLE